MLRNREIAELLSLEAKDHTGQRRRALQRAAREALWRWMEEAADLHARGRSLTELPLVGPWLASIIGRWLEEPPFGLAAAIRAGIHRDRVVNFLPRDEVLAWSRATRGAASRSG